MSFYKKHKTKIFIGIGISILAYIAYSLVQKRNKNRGLGKVTDDDLKENGNSLMNGSSSTDTQVFNENRLLAFGLNSKEVLLSQREINRFASLLNRAFPSSESSSSALTQQHYGSAGGFNFPLLVEDGKFGSKTKEYFNNLLGKDNGTYLEVKNKVKTEIEKVYTIKPELAGSVSSTISASLDVLSTVSTPFSVVNWIWNWF